MHFAIGCSFSSCPAFSQFLPFSSTFQSFSSSFRCSRLPTNNGPQIYWPCDLSVVPFTFFHDAMRQHEDEKKGRESKSHPNILIVGPRFFFSISLSAIRCTASDPACPPFYACRFVLVPISLPCPNHFLSCRFLSFDFFCLLILLTPFFGCNPCPLGHVARPPFIRCFLH